MPPRRIFGYGSVRASRAPRTTLVKLFQKTLYYLFTNIEIRRLVEGCRIKVRAALWR
jgi:hypothetical protein